ncbi:ATP adenylyltransferase family protein [Allopusillimonas ginsengisoli]|uniref:ATP adenylyltransferase family protein n=1 Tax=Allopusillimonas ginsengisoli TaxID=453575 RepID=UPI00101E913C|nr:DUF4922 domain-containing protein [Allopusillimonas ginsengisoli]TEA79509.1 phosphorylase [Allopusillimonas ginsengisoli]
MATDHAFIRAVDQRSVSARAAGALHSSRANSIQLLDRGLRFTLRWVPSGSEKDAKSAVLPGGPRDPNFNPFLSPDPMLTVGTLGDDHNVVLNKFPVCDRHLVLARKQFEEQRTPLALTDFVALARIMAEAGGLGFYNGGEAAGASQRHKHVQWTPGEPGNPGLAYLVDALPVDQPDQYDCRHPGLPFRHLFVRAHCGRNTDPDSAAASMFNAFLRACEVLELKPDSEGLLPPCNMLAQDGWLLMVPRQRERVCDVSVNSLSYGGALYITHPDKLDAVRSKGPLAVLAEAGFPSES